jgi:hypothetical protein
MQVISITQLAREGGTLTPGYVNPLLHKKVDICKYLSFGIPFPEESSLRGTLNEHFIFR